MLALHVYMLARRFKRENSEDSQVLSQKVFDHFIDDLDRALRELGVGDTTVPKRKKKMVRSFYGQIEDFDRNLDAGDMEAMSEKISTRYLNEDNGFTSENSGKLANYMLSVDRELDNQSYSSISAGNLVWPDLPV